MGISIHSTKNCLVNGWQPDSQTHGVFVGITYFYALPVPSLTYFEAGKRMKHQLLINTAMVFKWQLLAPAVPKLAWIGFTFCQPFLLRRFIRFLQELDKTDSPNVGYGLIAAYGIVYLGLAVSI